jgi:ABC-type uncharacterized transport system ATPase subunit
VTQAAPEVELRGIVKRFPGVLANDHADLTLERGEVHSLLGENGAGKTTLMCVLAGIYRPDEGTIALGSSEVVFRTPRQAIEAGIGMVHQRFRLVHPFTVAENVLLGTHGGLVLSRGDIERRVAQLSDQYGLHVKPSARVWQLSVGEQQRVEILKALFRRARVLILDEPTSVLTPQEAKSLFATLRKMAAEGRTVVFISHKLDEVMAVSDRISVMRAGARVATVERAATSKQELARLMVGRDVVFHRERRAPRAQGEASVCLRLRDVEADGDLGLPALRGVGLELREGEILGIAGVAGNGQRELTEVIAGTRRATAGTIEMSGRDVTAAPVRARIVGGLAYVPEDRLGSALVGSMDSTSNMIIKRVDLGDFSKGPLLDLGSAERATRELVERFDVKTSSLQAPVSLMSGGNIQKLLLARELSSEPRVLLAAQPTAGLDVGATEAIHGILLEQRSRGVGVLLVSEDLDELMSLADRIAVMYEGRVVGVVDAAAADRERIGLMMAGTTAEAGSPA